MFFTYWQRIFMKLSPKSTFVLVTLLSALLLPQFGHADNLVEQMRECARKDSNFQRLECFDTIADSLGAASPGSSLAAPTATPLPKIPSIRAKSKNPVTIQKKEIRPELRISCVAKKLTAQIDVGYSLPSAELSVNTRVDQADVRRERWGTSTTGGRTTTVIAPFPAQLVRDILGAKILEAKVMVTAKLPIAFSFEIGSFKSELESLRAECLGM